VKEFTPGKKEVTGAPGGRDRTKVSIVTSITSAPPAFQGGMLFGLLRLVNAPALTFAAVRARLAAVDDPSFLKAVLTDDAAAPWACLISHFLLLLVYFLFRSFRRAAGSKDRGLKLPQLPITFNQG
jgi:hypothetical protein